MASNANKIVVDVELRAQLDQMKSGVKELEGLFKGLNLSPKSNASFTNLFADMKKELKEIENLTDGGKIKGGDFSTLEKKVGNVTTLYNKLSREISSLSGKSGKELQKLFPPEIGNAINQATSKLKNYQTVLKQINNEDGGLAQKNSELQKASSNYEKLTNRAKELEETLNKYKNGEIQLVSTSEINKTANKIEELNTKLKQQQQLLAEAQQKLQNTPYNKTNNPAGGRSNVWKEADADVKAYEATIKELEAEIQKLTESFNQMRPGNAVTMTSELERTKASAKETAQQIETLKNSISELETANPGRAFELIKKEIQEIKGLDLDWKKITNIEELETALGEKVGTNLDEVIRKINELQSKSKGNIGNPLSGMAEEVQRANQALQQTQSSLNQIQQLAQRGLYFFGLTNQVNLFKRAVKSAFDTVKELDKAMTETAVVTDFSVSDMWDQLPQYTQIANQYSATLKDAYDVMTLYYQQGLETNQVFAVGEQTMKMARIAGLEYAEATDRMTNALRGFNMEINTTNSEHVADVYSQLAAMSASNVDELSVAMTKVASLANSANMSFDNTAAFLAQIIETTRESAETAGTALKTVVARFSEVKKLYSEGDLIGNVDGEEININKVGAALRAAGVDLNEFATGVKGLDEIFIELASKWDSLDLLTQRYIATMAAGSRQQSRFLALMSDNARLTELLNGAYSAAGASSEQFAKTEDSLESKLNKLKNAWDQFLMGITNSSVIKGAVDLLTKLITTLNKLLEAVGKMGSIPKALASIGLIAGTMKLGGAAVQFLATKFINFTGILRKTDGNVQNSIGLFKKFALTLSNIRASNFNLGPITDKINAFTASIQKKPYILTFKPEIVGTEAIVAEEAAIASENATMVTNNALRLTSNQLKEQEKAQSALVAAQEEANIAVYNAGNAAVESRLALTAASIDAVEAELLAQNKKIALNQSLIDSINQEELTETQLMALTDEKALLEAQEMANVKAHIELLKIKGQVERGEISTEEAAIAIKEIHSAVNVKEGITNFTLAGSFKALGAAIWAVIGPMVTLLATAAPAIAVFAAITAAIYGIVKAIEAAKEASASGQAALGIENTTIVIKGLQDSLDSTDQILQKLTQDWEAFTGTKDGLNNLIKGTAEWKEQLYDANQKILQLIQDFPDLAQYIKIGENGELYLSDEGIKKKDELEESYKTEKKNKQTAINEQLAQQEYYKSEQEALKEYKDSFKDNKDRSYSVIETHEAHLKGNYVSDTGDNIPDEEELYNYLKQRISKGIADADDEAYYKYLSKHLQAKETYKATNQANVISGLVDEGYSNLVAQATSNTLDEITNNLQKEQKNAAKGKGQAGGRSELEKYAKTINENYKVVKNSDDKGINYNIVDTSKKDKDNNFEVVYKVDMEGEAAGEGNFTNEQIQLIAEAAQEAEKSSQNRKKTANAISKLDKNYQYLLAGQYNEIENLDDLKYDKSLEGILNETEFIDKINSAKENLAKETATFAGQVKQIFDNLLTEETLKSFTKFTEESKDGYLTLGKLGADFDTVNKQSIETLEEFSKINLDDPIEGYGQLVDIAKNGSKEASSLAEEIISNNKGVFSSTKQVQTYAQQMTKETQEAILDLIKANGKITPENLKELAEEDERLQTLLDNNIVSANGLAKALQLVAQQKIGIEDLTNNFVNALNASRTLKDSILDIQNFISNFNATDYQVGYEWIEETTEKLKDIVEKKQWGQAQDYMTALFGAKNGGYSSEEIQTYYNQLSSYVESGGYGFFETIAGTYDDGVKIIAKNGKVTIDTAGKSYDELIELIHNKNEQFSKETIEMFLLNFAAYSSEFNEIVEDNALSDAVESMFDNIEGNLIISDQELENIAKAYGTSVDKIKAKIEEIAEEKKRDFQTFSKNKDGTISYITPDGKNNTYKPSQTGYFINGQLTQTLNYEKEFTKLQEITNWTVDQINEYLKIYAQEHDLKIKVTTEDGSTEFFSATDEELNKLLNSEDNVLKIDDRAIDDIQDKINKIFNETTYTLSAVIKWAWGGKNDEPKDELPTSEDTGGNAKNGTPLQHGKIKTYSRGGATQSENALVGEEGEELIQLKNGGAYLAGTNGPEMVQLHKGDIVYPNNETQKIFKRGGLTFNRYAEGNNEIRRGDVLYRKKFDGTWVRVQEPDKIEKPVNTYEIKQSAYPDITEGRLKSDSLTQHGTLTQEQTQKLVDSLDKELEEKQKKQGKKTDKEKEEKTKKSGAEYDRETFANAFSDARASTGSGNQYGQEVNNSVGWHRGVDLHNGGGPIPSISSGRVVSVVSGYKTGDKKANQGWGNQVIIQDEDGNKFYYSHLKDVSVSNGQVISPGQTIGTEGSTGNSTGSHLDFMVETSSGFVNPRAFINGAELSSLKGSYGGSVGHGSGTDIATADMSEAGNSSDNTTKENTKATEENTKATQDLANIEREQSKLQKQLSELQEGGIYTAPWQLKNLNEQRQLLKKEQKANKEILNQKQEEAKKLEEANAQWDKWLEKNEDGSYSYKEGYDDAVKNGTVDQTTRDNLSQLVSKGNEVADQQTTVDDYAYQVEEIRDQEYQVYADWIDQGVDWTNQAIEGAGQVAQSVLQMIEKVAQSMVDGFKSFLGWLTIRIDDEHDIGELNESLKNRKDLLDWEFDKYAEKNFDYTKGTNSKSQENLFENINDAAQNVLIRLQNQRRLYENSFRQLEDLGTNINSDIEASLEELYEALYGIDGVFTKINDKVQYLENRFERATKWNLTNIREMDPIQKINEWFGTNFEDTLGEALKPLNIFDGALIDTFFKKSLQQIAGLEITEYRLGNVGESLLQKVANFFYELSPKFDADYQIVNKSELVDALNQKMQTIITNDTITSQFVQNYLDYLTEIESQMESEVDNIRNAESEILSLYDEMTEILEKGKDEYGELEQQIYDAIVSEKESIKEELEELNDNITDADSDLINVLKNNLEQMRQMRENDKTESDLQDKEARLAYLRQDTSSANKQEILKLEKELKEGQQSYTDKLIDQKINELEKQNEEAAEQRQVQIDLLQEEINNTKNIWEKVKSMMDAISGYGSWDDILKGEIKREAYQNIIDQLKKASDFDEMSSFAQDNQINDWGVLIRKASLYGTMLKDEYQEAYNDLKILRDILDQDTKLPSDNAADSMWHNYVAFSNLETAVQDNTEAVKNAVSVINRIVDAKTLSFDETGSVFKKATESGATIQALSGLEDAVKNFANDMASGLPSILTQVTSGAGNLAKGLLKGMGAAADSGAGAMTGDIKLGDLGEAAGMVMEGVSNFFAAGLDAVSLMCDIIGDTSPGFTDMGVAAGTMIANWLDNAFEEVDDHLRENVGYILNEMYGEEIDGTRLGGYYQQIGNQIAEQKEALLQYFDANGKDGEDFVKKLYIGIEDRYKDINDQISKLDGNDIEGFNKQYSRFLALQKILEKIGHTEMIETYTSNSINNLNKWAGEIGSLFAELSEKERQIVVDAINNAIYDVIKDETLASGDLKSSIWESNLKFKTSDIKYYNDIYKEFVDNVNYSVDAIDEAITAINSVFYDPYENEYTSPSAQLLIRKLEQLEGKRAEQEVQFEKSVWETFIDRVEDAWGEFGNHILQIVDKGKVVIERIATFLEKTFGAGSRWADWIDAIDNSHALGGAIRQTERALVGELGPELVQHANGTATLVGRHGPEVTNLSAGDQVYTAEQTKKILRGGGVINFNRFAEGTVGNFIGRAPVLPGLTSIDITTPTRALASGQTNRENHFNLNLSLEDLTVDSIERVDEVANRVWDKLNSTISNAMWPYNKL